MKIKIIFFNIFIFRFLFPLLTFSQFFPDPGGHGTIEEKKMTIKQGSHSGSTKQKKVRHTHVNRRFKYHLAFWDECWYDPLFHGCGWNKVGRICYGNGGFNYNWHKLHVGWRAGQNPNEIRISAYFHDCNSDVQYFSQELTTVFTDYQVYVDMFLEEHIIALIIDNVCFGARQKNYFPPNKTSFLAHTFYFGGNCTAPHDMAVLFYNQDHDESGFATWFNTRDNMTWNASVFENGDIGTLFAYQEIHGSSSPDKVSSNLLCYPKQHCVIEYGADITFSSSGRVILHPGFHAKTGSHFRAIIEQKEKPDSLIVFPQKANLPPLKEGLTNYHITMPEGDTCFLEEDNQKMRFHENCPFRIYPNPNEGTFWVDFGSYEIKILDLKGNIISSINNIDKSPKLLKIHNMNKGPNIIGIYDPNTITMIYRNIIIRK